MEYWVNLNIKIVRNKILNERKFIIFKKPEGVLLEFNSKLERIGFS